MPAQDLEQCFGVDFGAPLELRMRAPQLGIVDDDAVVHAHGAIGDHGLVVLFIRLEAVRDKARMARHRQTNRIGAALVLLPQGQSALDELIELGRL